MCASRVSLCDDEVAIIIAANVKARDHALARARLRARLGPCAIKERGRRARDGLAERHRAQMVVEDLEADGG